MQLSVTGHHVEVTPAAARLRGEEARAHRQAFRPGDRRALRADGGEAAPEGRGDAARAAATPSTPTPPTRTCTPPSTLLADKLDRCVKKHKEKRADHHAAEARRAAPLTQVAAPRRRDLQRPGRWMTMGACASSSSAGCRAPARAWRCTCSRTSASTASTTSPRRCSSRSSPHGAQPASRPTSAPPSASTRATPPPRSRRVPQLIDELKRSGMQCEVLFLVAARRGAAAALRRDAPQAPAWRAATSSLREAMAMERALLEPIAYGRRPGDRHLAHGRARAARHHPQARRAAHAPAGCRSCSSPSASSTASRAMRISCSMRARCPIPTGSRRLRNLTGRDPDGDPLPRDPDRTSATLIDGHRHLHARRASPSTRPATAAT